MKVKSTLNVYWVQIPEEICLSEWINDLDLLDKEERTTYERYLVDQKKIEFYTGRLLLKKLLGQRLGIQPERVTFEKNPFGKLYLHSKLVQEMGIDPIFFNLSHSKRVVACVVSSFDEAGIDVEGITQNPLDIMPVVFVPQEQMLIEAENTFAEKVEAFYRVWTRKEAVMKAVGKGFSHPPLSFAVPVHGERVMDEDYHYYTFRPINGEIISVAVRREDGIEIDFECREASFLKVIHPALAIWKDHTKICFP
ncbi:4'-phosphopantetheinyl transferase superfamily protein [Paenibacillus sp. N4]|uniref:4'-phosphopantetheinyl transferase family protein n=1 Tax=Paenibacillus vietnamensis TaxID=2590547 RepID=UPI001CD04BB0|nr:4'-phosphopantetheinyl transferase superfamily protein [Paenibacillus vietnamensis]MCA0756967.1 4'-phosphopantetheinyl transferase superfamily protein [Paenibacillus vietnamensis]